MTSHFTHILDQICGNLETFRTLNIDYYLNLIKLSYISYVQLLPIIWTQVPVQLVANFMFLKWNYFGTRKISPTFPWPCLIHFNELQVKCLGEHVVNLQMTVYRLVLDRQCCIWGHNCGLSHCWSNVHNAVLVWVQL